ncbi:MAG: 2-oxo acid dehydrogenase subunit E2, partial [Alphaproteobacteria bacterium]|nr:2-oxo acid dehydrogenase subunit E2 [Alphaproteobacteria bacterium]
EEDPLAEVMTDKATVEIPAPVAGTVVSIHGKVGEKLAVGSDLLVLDVGGEAAANGRRPAKATMPSAPHPNPLRAGAEGARAADERPPPPAYREREGPVALRRGGEGPAPAPALPPDRTGKPLASPAVRKRAWDAGIPLQFVRGSGAAGRITHSDLDADANGTSLGDGAMPRATGLAKRDGVEDVPIRGLRRAIAERMQQAASRIPHFAYVEEVDVTGLEELRAHLNESHKDRGRLTLLPFLLRAIVNSVVEHPQVNARYDDEAEVLHRYRALHAGIATQTPGGLLVPVLRHAEALDLWQAAAEIVRLAEAARAGCATREELTGSTLTITSLGRLGGLAATPIINRPEVAIIGVNRIVERPVVRDGQIVVRKMMNLSSSFDHRIVDGWEAAAFIASLKGYLEQPATLFIG